jgi:hypothetical protein
MEKVLNSNEDPVKAATGDRKKTEKGEAHDCAKGNSEECEEDFWNKKKRCNGCDKEESTRIRIQDCCECFLDKCDDCAIQWWTCTNCCSTVCRECGNRCSCDNPREDEWVREWSTFVAKDMKNSGGAGLKALLCRTLDDDAEKNTSTDTSSLPTSSSPPAKRQKTSSSSPMVEKEDGTK